MNDPAYFSGDLVVVTNVGEDTSGVVDIYDQNAFIRFDISDNTSPGELSYSSVPTDASSVATSNSIRINWVYKADDSFTGEESFTITTTDQQGGITSQQIIIRIPYIYEITDISDLGLNMKSVHDNLNPIGTSVSVTNTSNGTIYLEIRMIMGISLMFTKWMKQ